MVITVKDLRKEYSVYKKAPGFVGSLSSLFHRRYETVSAVADISFAIAEGELVGFIGPNGAGKTTTLKCLSGLLYPTSGDVRVLGYEPWKRSAGYLKQIALVMGQKNQLWWDLPASETFLLNKEIYGVADREYRKTLSDLTDLLAVDRLLGIPVRKLSLGERMKMELIAALIHTPRVLFLDEPTIGLDVVMQKQLRDFIGQYNRTRNATIILTSHYMEDVKQLASRVIVIDHGRILYDGTLAALTVKFATEKVLSVIFDERVDQKALARIGTLVSYDYPRAVIRVPRAETAAAASRLLRKFPVDDINIEEPDVEDVIRDVFTAGKR